ncbi:MAG TPA: class I SAM-dependent methyltransferase [Acidimicrobiales bacterium]|nr:class I SAM-dependent methyltransferase [Acidimicrobiales bacterium]
MSSFFDSSIDEQVGLYAFQVWTYKQGEVVALMIHLGDRLGLYRSLAGAGPVTPAELSSRTGFHERWLQEWLRSQAAAGLLRSEDGAHFELPVEAEPVLVDEGSSLWFAAGAFRGAAAAPEVVDRLAEAFATGRGLTYDDQGPSVAHAVERMLGPWTRLALVPTVLPALDGVARWLNDGAHVADVGCGAGVAVITMARAFPRSSFDGFDPSEHAIRLARQRAAEAGAGNVSFHIDGAADLPRDGRYDLVLTLDCLHDMPRPDEAAAAIRRAVREDGTWLIKEIRAGESWEENRRNPVLAMMYGTSLLSCMSSALSEPGGAGLGTLGLPPSRLEALCRQAGFTRFLRHDFDDPANLYYEVRP